jgi:hypothetical protein
MLNETRLQVAGPISVIATTLCAQLCAHALAQWPTSSIAWYLNLEVFRSLRYGIDVPAAEECLGGNGLAQSTWIAALLLGLVSLGVLLKSRLPLAIASHFSVIYSALMFCGGFDVARSALSFAKTSVYGLWQPSSFLTFAILLASILSSTISHWGYWREISSSCRHMPHRSSRSYSLNFAHTQAGTT